MDLASTINRHIHLFGNKTWWSTKDNSKTLEKNHTYYQKKKIDEEVAGLERKKEEESKKLAEQMLNLFKTSDVIEKTQRLMGEQFKLNIAVQSIAWAYSGINQVDQAFQDFMKTTLKLLLEGKF